MRWPTMLARRAVDAVAAGLGTMFTSVQLASPAPGFLIDDEFPVVCRGGGSCFGRCCGLYGSCSLRGGCFCCCYGTLGRRGGIDCRGCILGRCSRGRGGRIGSRGVGCRIGRRGRRLSRCCCGRSCRISSRGLGRGGVGSSCSNFGRRRFGRSGRRSASVGASGGLANLGDDRIAPGPAGIVKGDPEEGAAVAREFSIVVLLEIGRNCDGLSGVGVGAGSAAVGNAVTEHNLCARI